MATDSKTPGDVLDPSIARSGAVESMVPVDTSAALRSGVESAARLGAGDSAIRPSGLDFGGRSGVEPLPEREPWPAGRSVAHRYEIERPLGGGSMGDVYLVHDRLLKKQVAMKVLHAELAQSRDTVRRFLREVALAHSVTHRNVVRIYDTGEEEGLPFFTMEYLQGQTLEELLETRLREGNEKLSFSEIRKIAFEVLDAMDTAHRVGVVHRDLKPGNVMLTHRGAIVMDFGVAGIDEVADNIHPNSQLRSLVRTEIGTIFGSPAYMAPELWEGAPASVQSDLYAFGVMLYQMITGRLPYEARTPAAYLQKLNAGHPPPIRSVRRDTPWNLVRLVRRCMAPSPEDRPTSAAAATNLISPLRNRDRRRIAYVAALAGLAALGLVLSRSTPTWQDLGLPDRMAEGDLSAAVRTWDVGDETAAARSLARLAASSPRSAAVRFWRATVLHGMADENGRRAACTGDPPLGSPLWRELAESACGPSYRLGSPILRAVEDPGSHPELLPLAVQFDLLPRVEGAVDPKDPVRELAIGVLDRLADEPDWSPMWSTPTRWRVARADLELALGRVGEARQRIELLAEADPDAPLVQRRAGWIALHTGDLDRARSFAERLRPLDPTLWARLSLEDGELEHAWEVLSTFAGSPRWDQLRSVWCGYALRFQATTLPSRCADLPPGLSRAMWGLELPPTGALDPLQAEILARREAIEAGQCDSREPPTVLTHAPAPFETYLFELEIRAALCKRDPARSDPQRARTLVNQLAGFAPESPWVHLLQAEVNDALGADKLAEAKRMAVVERWRGADAELPRVGEVRQQVKARSAPDPAKP